MENRSNFPGRYISFVSQEYEYIEPTQYGVYPF